VTHGARWVILAAVLGLALGAGGVGWYVLSRPTSPLVAAIDGYRASVNADYADRQIRIRDLTSIGRASVGVISDLRREVNVLQGSIRAGAAAEAERQRREAERTDQLANDLGGLVQSSGNTTDLLRQLVNAIRGFVGQ
jgi:hypothetical protein